MISTLFVVEEPALFETTSLEVISFKTYLHDYPKLNETKTRIINLCDTSRYLSQGYYCSLLAEARDHHVLPSVKVINELNSKILTLIVDKNLLPKSLQKETFDDTIIICMGQTQDTRFQKLANWAFQEYRLPVLKLQLKSIQRQLQATLNQVVLTDLDDNDKHFCLSTLEHCAQTIWRSKSDRKKYRWEMAILLNEDEVDPPSNKGAINRFIKAGEKLGIRVATITPGDFTSIGQYDALFIRETTQIDHHTYRFAAEAEKLGLVVIDDAASILRCCNKVYLHDAFTYNKVPSLRTFTLSDAETHTIDHLEATLNYPMILKMPESAFSRGVFKVKNREELLEKAQALLAESALYIVQEYLLTDYDWRIGILNGRALYACRYFMAKNHWQIYNHHSKRNTTGGFDALPTFEVPSHVLKAALSAASVVGKSLYGIDIKEVNGKAYVLEVNDNPSIEHGVEDKYLGEELYMQIMAEFLRRLEARGLEAAR